MHLSTLVYERCTVQFIQFSFWTEDGGCNSDDDHHNNEEDADDP